MTQSSLSEIDPILVTALSVLLQVFVVSALVLLSLGFLRRQHVVRHALCLGAMICCMVCPLITLMIPETHFEWIRISLPDVEHPGDSRTTSVAGPHDLPGVPVRANSDEDNIDRNVSIAGFSSQTAVKENGAKSSESRPDSSESAFPSEAVPLSESTADSFVGADPTTAENSATSRDASADRERSIVPVSDARVLPSRRPLLPAVVPADYTLPESAVIHDVAAAAVGLWLIAVPFLCGRFLIRSVRFYRLLQQARYVDQLHVRELLQTAGRNSGLRNCPVVVTAEWITSPFVAGIRSPVIAVPEFLTGVDQTQALYHVLNHEVCHIRRRDLLMVRLQRCVRMIFWIVPQIHIISHVLTRVREEICDNHVLKFSSPVEYSRTLLTLTEHRNSGIQPAVSLGILPTGWSLESRIRGLLAPHRYAGTRLSRRTRAGLFLGFLSLTTLATGITVVPSDVPAESSPAESLSAELPSVNVSDPVALVRKLIRRSEWWTGKHSNSLQSLSYVYSGRGNPQPVDLVNGKSKVTLSHWHGTTFQPGFFALANDPERFDVTVTDGTEIDEPGIVRLNCVVRDRVKPVNVRFGNGIEGSWSGYFSHATRRIVLDIDLKRLVPVREQLDATVVRYDQWKQVDDQHWVPGLVSIRRQKILWNMHFDWVGDAAWLLRYTESGLGDNAVIVARTVDVKVNDELVRRPQTDAERLREAAAAPLIAMMKRCQRWLKPNLRGMESIQYTFHTEREDVKEVCCLRKDGTAVFDVIHDGNARLNGRPDRKIALPDGSWASARRSDEFAAVMEPTEGQSAISHGSQLRRYAATGCQLDLPLFRLEDQLATAGLQTTMGEWNDVPCDVVRISGLERDVFLGAGTMLAFPSWSYVHHIVPETNTLYIDRARHLPLHETIRSHQDRVFEIDYGSWTRLENDQWVPLSIRIESRDYFTCEYTFQLVDGSHWLLHDLTSWFDAEDKSHATVSDIQVDAASPQLKNVLTQVDAARRLFSEDASVNSTNATLVSTPLRFGQWVTVGRFRVMLTLFDPGQMQLVLETGIRPRDSVPVLAFDQDGRAVEFFSADMIRDGELWKASLRVSSVTDASRLAGIAIAGESTAVDRFGQVVSLPIVPIRIGSQQNVLFSDADTGKTRIARIHVDRTVDGRLSAVCTVVSINGPQQFPVTVSMALMDRAGRPIACGQRSESIRVDSAPETMEMVIDFGVIQDADQVASVAAAIVNGNPTSMPLGSRWGVIARAREINVPMPDLFQAVDESCHLAAIDRLQATLADKTLDKELFGTASDLQRLQERHGTRQDILKPYASNLTSIVEHSQSVQARRNAIRLLGHLGDRSLVPVIRPLLQSADAQTCDMAAVAMGMLGDDSGLSRLREILSRPAPSWSDETDLRRTYDRLEKDVLIALATGGSDQLTQLLGSTLMKDLTALTVAKDDHGRSHAAGRLDRAQRSSRLLYHAGAQAVPWVRQAAEYLHAVPQIADHFDMSGLDHAMIQLEPHCRDLVIRQIRSQDSACLRLLKELGNPVYVSSVHEVLRDESVSDFTYRTGISYLWNVGTAPAVHALRDLQPRAGQQSVPARMLICEALISLGDDRCFHETLDAMTQVLQGETQSDDKAALKDRRNQIRSVENVLGRATPEMILHLVRTNLDTDDDYRRRAIIMFLDAVGEIPLEFQSVIRHWADSGSLKLRQETQTFMRRHGLQPPS